MKSENVLNSIQFPTLPIDLKRLFRISRPTTRTEFCPFQIVRTLLVFPTRYQFSCRHTASSNPTIIGIISLSPIPNPSVVVSLIGFPSLHATLLRDPFWYCETILRLLAGELSHSTIPRPGAMVAKKIHDFSSRSRAIQRTRVAKRDFSSCAAAAGLPRITGWKQLTIVLRQRTFNRLFMTRPPPNSFAK